MTERHGDLTMTLEQASLFKMTLTPRDVKGKSWSKDWHIRYLPETDDVAPEALSNLKCPFDTIPRPKDSVPAEFTENVQHLLSSQETGAPYTGYYARLNNALVSVSNVYGVWFEVRVQGNKFECFRLAWNELGLKNHPLLGINFISLEQSGEPSWPPSRAEGPSEPKQTMPFTEAIIAATEAVQKEQKERPLTPFDDPSDNESEDEDFRPKYKDVFGSFGMQSSQTACNKPPRWPRSTGDDPFSLENLPKDDKEDKACRLKGIHPDKFNGDRSQTTRFLATFNRFMLMNYRADITKDPIMHSIYFLSLLEGPKCEGWVDAADRWLRHVVEDPSMIPRRSNAWKELEKCFKEAFSDYAEWERAQDELKKLKMKNDNLDKYLAAFETQALCADIDMNDHTNLRTFALGLPRSLADACIKMENPETYEQWRATVQCQQKIYLKTKSLHSKYGTFSNRTQGQGQRQTSGWVWRRPGGNNPGSNNQNWCRPGNCAPPWPRLPPRDDNAMDTSAVICKATNDKEREEYWKTGRCFECGKQGHLVRNCPNKKTRACTTHTIQIKDDEKPTTPETSSPSTSLAAQVARLSEEDRCAFMDEMRSLGEDMDFQAAWVLQLLLGQFSIILVLCT